MPLLLMRNDSYSLQGSTEITAPPSCQAVNGAHYRARMEQGVARSPTSKRVPKKRRKAGAKGLDRRILSDPAVAAGTAECALTMPANEKRRPLAIVFYDAENDKLNFDRSEGTT